MAKQDNYLNQKQVIDLMGITKTTFNRNLHKYIYAGMPAKIDLIGKWNKTDIIKWLKSQNFSIPHDPFIEKEISDE